VSEVTAADDRFHAPGESDPMWSETAWFAFMLPERRLGGTIYPLFRPNLGTCSLAVYVWDDRAHEPWRVPYGRSLWHLPMPDGDLTDLRVGGLEYRCLEALRRYEVRYRDGDLLELDLCYEGLMSPHAVGIGGGRGHVDQPCRVTGTLRLHGEPLAVDCLDMRDRSWHVRDDARSTRASYSYAIASASDAFLAGGFWDGSTYRIVAGYLLRDGEKADLVSGTRRVIERHDGATDYPLRVRIEAEDRLGRRLEAEGATWSRLANPATPGMFAWMSLAEWDFGSDLTQGADQDVWSPDLLASLRSTS
jgi:hypothetical protein